MSVEPTHVIAARCSWICVALAAIPTMLVAETEEEANVRANAASLTAELRTEFECTIVVTGTPRFDEFANAWLIAFTAAGPGCDAAASTLIRRGREMGATFFRRPDRDQVKAILADLRRTVRRGFGCPISIRGEPQPEEPSGYWVVNIVGSGADCEDASRSSDVSEKRCRFVSCGRTRSRTGTARSRDARRASVAACSVERRR